MSFGKWLKEKRAAANLSQGDVAKELKYSSPQFVSNWERDLSLPTKSSMKTLSKLYNIEEKELRGEIVKCKVREIEQEWLG